MLATRLPSPGRIDGRHAAPAGTAARSSRSALHGTPPRTWTRYVLVPMLTRLEAQVSPSAPAPSIVLACSARSRYGYARYGYARCPRSRDPGEVPDPMYARQPRPRPTPSTVRVGGPTSATQPGVPLTPRSTPRHATSGMPQVAYGACVANAPEPTTNPFHDATFIGSHARQGPQPAERPPDRPPLENAPPSDGPRLPAARRADVETGVMHPRRHHRTSTCGWPQSPAIPRRDRRICTIRFRDERYVPSVPSALTTRGQRQA